MVKHEARTQELLRERVVATRRRQLWAALAVIWGVALGWVAWGLAGMWVDSDAVAWLVYLVPLAVLVGIAISAWARVRRIDQDLVHVAEESPLA